MKKWIISPSPPKEFFDTHPELPPIVVRLLWNRDFKTQKQIDEFLNPDYSQDLHDPYLFKDMSKAVDLIFDCIKNNNKITVHGDYDADGVCASVIIVNTLQAIGATAVDVFLPHRETDGYGLNKNTINYLKKNDTNLIITCDCGISNNDEIELAQELGLKVIVTDHHAMPVKFPPADAIIHPLVPNETYPDKTLAGGGVAFKLAQALLIKHKESHATLPNGELHEGFEKWLLDLVAISTVADMVSLTGESRTLVRYGLKVLNKTRNIGLKQLLISSGIADQNGRPKKGKYDTQTIGFKVGPRINAAGRMDHANVALALLSAATEAEAIKLTEQLNQNNTDRQKLTEKIVKTATKQIKETNQTANPILFGLGNDWPTGVLGLIASRIKDKFNKPTIIMGKTNGQITGSGRSIDGFNLIEVLKSAPEYFTKFGGHPMACGFSLKKDVEKFKQMMLKKAKVATANIDLTPQIEIDIEIDLDDVNWKLYDLLKKFEPFGQGNPEPVYAAKDLTLVTCDPVGADGKHLRIMVKHNSHVVKKTIAFGFGDTDRHEQNWKAELKPGHKIDLAFTVSVNEWNGTRELQLEVKDIKKSKQ